MKSVKSVFRCAVIVVMCSIGLFTNAFADSVKTAGAFPDVPPDAEYAEAAEALHEMGIFNGDSKGNFNPDKTISRAETAAILCRLLGVAEEAKGMTESIFSDVPSSHWAVGYVAKMSQLEIISGYGNGEFGPSNAVTYNQLVKMLVCTKGYEEAAIKNGGYPDGYVAIANELGITNGIPTTSNNGISRGKAAMLVYNCVY